jgi:hypothetical protein
MLGYLRLQYFNPPIHRAKFRVLENERLNDSSRVLYLTQIVAGYLGYIETCLQ